MLRRFYRVLGPFVGVPFHAVLRDRDVGGCGDVERVSWVASKLPGLDGCGCGAFEIGNVSFVTLNGVALLCGDGELRFEVERVVERESLEVRVGNGNGEDVVAGSGPVVLLHLPLYSITSDGKMGPLSRYRCVERLVIDLRVCTLSFFLSNNGLKF